jgi:hypothetical protein
MVQGVVFVQQKLLCDVAKDVHPEVELLPNKLYPESHKCLMCSFPSAFFKMQLHFLRHFVHERQCLEWVGHLFVWCKTENKPTK